MVVRVPANLWSGIAGVLFATAWMLLIDAQVYDLQVFMPSKDKDKQFQEVVFWNWLPAIPCFFGFFFLQIIPRDNLIMDSDDDDDRKVVWRNRIFVLIAVVVLFVGLIIGAAVMISDFAKPEKLNIYGKIVTMLHPMLITLAALVMFLGKLFGDKLRFGN